MKTNENQKSTNHQPAAQKPFFGTTPDHAFFSAERAASPPFFQPKVISPSAIQAKSATSEAEGINQPLVQRMPAFESEITANGGVHRKLMNSPALPIQAKLTIGEPEDKYEQEADRVASQVVEQINAPAPSSSGDMQSLQRMGEKEEEMPVMPKMETVQRMGEEDEDIQMMPKLDTVQRMGHDGGEATGELKSAIAPITTSVVNNVAQKKTSGTSSFQFVDNRPEAIAQRKLQEIANNSPLVKQAAQLQIAANHQAQQQQPSQKKASPEPGGRENNTGLPDNLKSGTENLSGYSMDDVKVHYNSDKPSQLQAHAYAQGTDIHLAPGQERHLPHEAWHVVQQKQGRVKPTSQLKGKLNVNDDAGLEKEADVMGAKALSVGYKNNYTTAASPTNYINSTQLKTSSVVNNVVQAYKLVNFTKVKDKLLDLKAYTATEADSISKEFPSWYQKNKDGRLRDHDFASDDAFLSMIREMITTVDSFTDKKGFALRGEINSSKSLKIFLGYNAGNAAYADDMEKNGLKSKKVDSGLKADMQLSHGHYISPSRSELDSYIAERTLSGKDAVVYEVYLDLTNVVKFPIMMKGASVMQWWSNYDTSFDDDYDIVVAALSGHTDIIQYKINPKSYHLVTFNVVERYSKNERFHNKANLL